MATRSQPITTAAQLGVLVRSARKSRKLTQSRLAARMGISQTRMSDLELSPGTLSVDQLLAVCAQLGLQLTVQPREEDPVRDPAGTDW